MADVFISYASDDRARARQLAERLTTLGWSVWWDRNIPIGKKFDDVIAAELAVARCVIVLWSQKSVASGWVREEATVAQQREVLVPALIDHVEIPLGFRRIQAAQLQAWQGNPTDEAFRDVVSAVSAIVGGEVARTVARRPRQNTGWQAWRKILISLGVGALFLGIYAANFPESKFNFLMVFFFAGAPLVGYALVLLLIKVFRSIFHRS